MPEDSEQEAGPPTLSSAVAPGMSPAVAPGTSSSLSSGVSSGGARLVPLDEIEEIDDDVLEVEPEPFDAGDAPPNGFHAFLRHANLHNLLQIESLSRTTGVFLVVSGGSRGYLHLTDGELVHAETGRSSGEAAASEILSWEDGEFKSCARALAPVRTVHSSVQSLLMRMAQESDEASHAARHHRSSRVVRRPLDQDAPTETHLPPAVPPGGATAGVASPPPEASPAAAEHSASLPAPSGKSDRPPSSVADVLLSSAGEIVQGRGAATEEFAARVAYAARLADLIGRAIRSGTPRAVELRGKSTQTVVQWQAEGNLSASLELAQPPRR